MHNRRDFLTVAGQFVGAVALTSQTQAVETEGDPAMRATEFIRPGLSFDVLRAERVEDILPRLRAAVAGLPDEAREMAPEVARRL